MKKHPLSAKQIEKINYLSKKIQQSANEEQKNYYILRLYLLLLYIDNNYQIKNKEYSKSLNEKFNTCVTDLCGFFRCTPNTLPSRIISTIGKEVEPGPGHGDLQRKERSLLYFTRQEAEVFKTIIKDGKLLFQQKIKPEEEQNSDTYESKEFVMSFSGDIYLIDEQRKKIAGTDKKGVGNWTMHHSSFLSGDEVLCAGMMKLKNNKIVEISNDSGHYHPSHREIALLLNHLDGMGVDLSEITLKLVYPALKIRADVFLTNHQELQNLNSNLYHVHEQFRMKYQRATSIMDDYHRIRKSGACFDYINGIEELYNNFLNSGDTTKELAKKFNDISWDRWSGIFLNKPDSKEAIASLLYLKNDCYEYFDLEFFNKKLKENNIPEFSNITAIQTSKEEAYKLGEADLRASSPEVIKKNLEDLKNYIENNKWNTFRSSIGFFNKKDTRPYHVDLIQGYAEILKIAKHAIEHPSLTRRKETQEFYDKIANNDLLDLISENNENKSDLDGSTSIKGTGPFQSS